MKDLMNDNGSLVQAFDKIPKGNCLRCILKKSKDRGLSYATLKNHLKIHQKLRPENIKYIKNLDLKI